MNKENVMLKAVQVMTNEPVCCLPDTPLQEVAGMMIKYDCGEIPVVDSLKERRIVGVITDRDICCRTVGKGLNPLEMKTSEAMTFPAVYAKQDTSIDQCCELMETNRIRRIPVVDDYERVCGIISLADLVRRRENEVSLGVLKEVSKPSSVSLQ